MAADNSVLVRIGAKIDDFKAKMKEVTKKMDEVGDKMSGIGDQMKDVGGNLTTGVSAPLMALGGVAAKTASDFESAGSRMQTQLGLTAQEAEELQGVARAVWRNGFGENIGEATDAVSALKQQLGDVSPEELQKTAEAAFTLRDAFGADITESTRTASVMMKNFGIDATTAMDLMTVGFQKGGDYSGELLDTMREYSPAFSTMGMSAEDMMGTLIAGAEAGAWNLDKVGDAVKEFNIRAKDGSKTTAEGFAAIGLNAAEMGAAIAEGGTKGEQAFQATLAGLAAMEDPIARNQAGVALFGTQWEDLEADVVTAMANGKTALGEFEGASATAADTMYNNFSGRLTTALRGLGEALLPLGEILLSMIERLLPYLEAFAAKLSGAFAQASPGVQVAVTAFGIFMAALGPVLTILGILVGAIGNLIPIFTKVWPVIKTGVTWFGKLRKIFTVVRVALLGLTGPVGIVIAVVAGLIAIGIAVYRNWDTVKAKLTAVWNTLKALSSAVFNAMKRAIVEKVVRTVADIKSKWNTIMSFFRGINLRSIGTNIVAGLARGISAGWTKIKSAVQGLADMIPDWAKEKLGIASPSKVADREIGQEWGAGIVRGLKKSGASVSSAASWLADRAMPDLNALSFLPSMDPYAGFDLAFAAAGATGSGAATAADESVEYVFSIPVVVDGREVARATARYTEEEIEKFKQTRQRAAGVVVR